MTNKFDTPYSAGIEINAREGKRSRDVVVEIDMEGNKFKFYEANGLIYDCSSKENLFTKMCMLADHYNNDLGVGIYFTVR